jgi:biotin synthase
MIATLRLMMPDINIASTTALQALNSVGRELGLKAGANVIMPIVTPTKYREDYQLYQDKPCINESSDDCMHCITRRIRSVNLNPAFGEWGDSKHFFKRLKNVS